MAYKSGAQTWYHSSQLHCEVEVEGHFRSHLQGRVSRVGKSRFLPSCLHLPPSRGLSLRSKPELLQVLEHRNRRQEGIENSVDLSPLEQELQRWQQRREQVSLRCTQWLLLRLTFCTLLEVVCLEPLGGVALKREPPERRKTHSPLCLQRQQQEESGDALDDQPEFIRVREKLRRIQRSQDVSPQRANPSSTPGSLLHPCLTNAEFSRVQASPSPEVPDADSLLPQGSTEASSISSAPSQCSLVNS